MLVLLPFVSLDMCEVSKVPGAFVFCWGWWGAGREWKAEGTLRGLEWPLRCVLCVKVSLLICIRGPFGGDESGSYV